MALSITTLIITIKKCDIKHNDTQHNNFKKCHIKHNDTQHNNLKNAKLCATTLSSQHNNKKCYTKHHDTQHNGTRYRYALLSCHCAECHCDECRMLIVMESWQYPFCKSFHILWINHTLCLFGIYLHRA